MLLLLMVRRIFPKREAAQSTRLLWVVSMKQMLDFTLQESPSDRSIRRECSCFLTLDHETSRHVLQLHTVAHLVDFLTSWPGAADKLLLELGFIELRQSSSGGVEGGENGRY